MKIFLAIIAMLALFGAAGVLGNSKSAIHEIEAFILGIICVNAMVGAGIIEAITKANKKEPPNS